MKLYAILFIFLYGNLAFAIGMPEDGSQIGFIVRRLGMNWTYQGTNPNAKSGENTGCTFTVTSDAHSFYRGAIQTSSAYAAWEDRLGDMSYCSPQSSGTDVICQIDKGDNQFHTLRAVNFWTQPSTNVSINNGLQQAECDVQIPSGK
jgi:hypothetical protein